MKSNSFVLFWTCCGIATTVFAEEIHPGYGLIEALFPGTGSTGNAGPFRSDYANVSGGTLVAVSGTMINTNAAGCWAPMRVYQSERYNKNMTITVRGLTPGASYITELHNSEDYNGSSMGFRIFDYYVNDVLILNDYDIVKETGNKFTAVCTVTETTASSSGEILFSFSATMDNARYSGITVFGSSAPSAFTSFTMSKVSGSTDLAVMWSASHDTYRYYLQRADSVDGPWTDFGVYLPETTGVTLPSAYHVTESSAWRIVASNGVGITASSPRVLEPPRKFTDIEARESVIPNTASANVRIASPGKPDAGTVTRADPLTQIASLRHDTAQASVITPGSDEILRTSAMTITMNGGNPTVGDVIGRGALLPFTDSSELMFSVMNPLSTITVNAAVSNENGSVLSLVKSGPCAVYLASGVNNMGSIDIGGGSLALWNNVLSGPGTFIKRGAGRLDLNRKDSMFTGDMVVENGTLLLSALPALSGADECSLIISNGAALDVSAPTGGGYGGIFH